LLIINKLHKQIYTNSGKECYFEPFCNSATLCHILSEKKTNDKAKGASYDMVISFGRMSELLTMPSSFLLFSCS